MGFVPSILGVSAPLRENFFITILNSIFPRQGAKAQSFFIFYCFS